jgi:hypothetical protein
MEPDPNVAPAASAAGLDVPAPINLATATDAELYLYALTLDEDDPVVGLIAGSRDEALLIAEFAEHADEQIDPTELAPVLERSGRRLEVAIELIERRRRALTSPMTPAT